MSFAEESLGRNIDTVGELRICIQYIVLAVLLMPFLPMLYADFSVWL